jgi:hypothetical protein
MFGILSCINVSRGLTLSSSTICKIAHYKLPAAVQSVFNVIEAATMVAQKEKILEDWQVRLLNTTLNLGTVSLKPEYALMREGGILGMS